MDNALLKLAYDAAAKEGLDPQLVAAVVEQESSWQSWAVRYEPAFYSRYVTKLGLDITEAMGRAFSYGLMQVLGEVAREFGYAQPKPLPKLFEPETNLAIGCRVLKHKLGTAKGDVVKALLFYNGGSNTKYPQQVLDRMKNYPKEI